VIALLRAALASAMAREIDLVQRRTYQEVTGLLLEGGVDAAWLCGYPFLQHRAALALVGVPLWRGQPLYQSYLIAGRGDPAQTLADLRDGVHAFSDPDSNSGYLVTASDLARMGATPERFFAHTLFTYGHRNVVRAVAAGLTRSGGVDGYVWEALAQVEPALTARSRVVARSEWLGFPPFCARQDRRHRDDVVALATHNLGQMGGGRVRMGGHQEGYARPSDAHVGRPTTCVDQLLINGKGGVHHIWACNHYRTTLNATAFKRACNRRAYMVKEAMDAVAGGSRERLVDAIVVAIKQGGLLAVTIDIIQNEMGSQAHVAPPAAQQNEMNLTSMNGERRMRLAER